DNRRDDHHRHAEPLDPRPLHIRNRREYVRHDDEHHQQFGRNQVDEIAAEPLVGVGRALKSERTDGTSISQLEPAREYYARTAARAAQGECATDDLHEADARARVAHAGSAPTAA